MINLLLLAVALVISAVAAYYSVVGMTAIFAGAFWPVVVMATSLEGAKVVCTSWLYRHWDTVSLLIKYYLITAVVVVSFITSLGIFGFLSKAHTDTSIAGGVNVVKIETINQQLTIEKQRLDILLSQSKQYSAPIRRLERQIDDTQNKINQLIEQRQPLLQQQTTLEAEVGPLKYVAEILYGQSDQSALNSAIKALIILIVFVFDPLALAMLIAYNHGTSSRKSEQPLEWTNTIKTGRRKITLDRESIHTIK